MNTKRTSRQSALRLGMTSLLLGVVAVGSSNIAFAQNDPGTPLPGTPGFTMTFDENGHATINGQPAQGVAFGGGVGVGYVLPGPVAPGQVFVVALPGDITATDDTGISDLLNFQQGGPTGGLLIYQSLLDDNSPPDLADVLNLFPVLGPIPIVDEMGPEGSNGFQWIATNSTTGATAIYNGISDTPEPSTFILVGLALIALFLIGRPRGTLKKV